MSPGPSTSTGPTTSSSLVHSSLSGNTTPSGRAVPPSNIPRAAPTFPGDAARSSVPTSHDDGSLAPLLVAPLHSGDPRDATRVGSSSGAASSVLEPMAFFAGGLPVGAAGMHMTSDAAATLFPCDDSTFDDSAARDDGPTGGSASVSDAMYHDITDDVHEAVVACFAAERILAAAGGSSSGAQAATAALGAVKRALAAQPPDRNLIPAAQDALLQLRARLADVTLTPSTRTADRALADEVRRFVAAWQQRSVAHEAAKPAAGASEKEQVAWWTDGCDEILPGLFVGSRAGASDTPLLQQHGIRAVVSCVGVVAAGIQRHVCLDIDDSPDAPLLFHAQRCLEVVRKECINAQRAVLIHCSAGVSRAPALAAFAICSLLGIDVGLASSVLKRSRRCTKMNDGFEDQLADIFPVPTAQQRAAAQPRGGPLQH